MAAADCSISNCSLVADLIDKLKQYNSFNSSKDENFDTSVFNEFIDVCKKADVKDKFIHMLKVHNKEIDEIYNIILSKYSFQPCNISNCRLTVRHYRNKQNSSGDNINTNEETIFWRDFFDCVHCYVLHLFDFGYKVRKTDLTQDDDAKYDHDNDDICKYIDKKFKLLYSIISEKRNKLKSISSIDAVNTNKFNIDVDTTDDTINQQQEAKIDHDDVTFMDELYERMHNGGVPGYILSNFNSFIEAEEFDTDSVTFEINMMYESNISRHLNNVSYTRLIYRFIKARSLASHSFDIGFIFYYWSWYENMKENEQEQNKEYWNPNNYQGYSQRELFVKQKYKDMKYELRHNSIFPVNCYNFNIAVKKAMEYSSTDHAKKFKAAGYDVEKDLHYGMLKGNVLTFNHLLSIIFYCDFSDLSKAFSATFCKKNVNESLSSIKSRNSEFWHWSKHLRETIEYYGSNYLKDNTAGPFYCGMNFEMIIPEFNIRLCGPTSTSTAIEVASRFAGPNGIIMQLNNVNGEFNSQLLSSFECSWISKFNGESEQLFMGGHKRIRIETIRLVSNKNNYSEFFTPFYYFHSMINGTELDDDQYDNMTITKRDRTVLNTFIGSSMNISYNNYDSYINNTWDTFTNNQQEIVLNIHYINEYFSDLKDLILGYDNNDNLFDGDVLFAVFPNLTSITIYSSDAWGKKQYPFKLLSLFRLLESTEASKKKIKVTIKSTCKKKSAKKYSWIHTAYNSELNQTTSKWNISLTQTKDYYDTNKNQDCLVIRSKQR